MIPDGTVLKLPQKEKFKKFDLGNEGQGPAIRLKFDERVFLVRDLEKNEHNGNAIN